MTAGIVNHQNMPRPAMPAMIRARKILLTVRYPLSSQDKTGLSMVRNPGRIPELNFAAFLPDSGIKPKSNCFEIDANREKTMSRTAVKLATLAFGAAFAFAGP